MRLTELKDLTIMLCDIPGASRISLCAYGHSYRACSVFTKNRLAECSLYIATYFRRHRLACGLAEAQARRSPGLQKVNWYKAFHDVSGIAKS